MGDIYVLVDSTANISREVLESEKFLRVIPLTVMVGEEQWLEDQLPTEELFRIVRETGVFPKTSQPAPGQFNEVITPLIAQNNKVIIITIASGLSGTINSARAAAQMIGGQNIYIVDSGTTALGLEMMAKAALKMAEQGMEAAEIADYIQDIADHTRTLFVPDTLEYLHKGGRIGGAAALIGALLQIKPVLQLIEGKVTVMDKVRTKRRALARLVEELQKEQNLAYIGVVHIEALPEAEELRHNLELEFPGVLIHIGSGGSVLGSHLGPGLVGLIVHRACSL